MSNLKSFLIGSKTTKEEKTFGGGLNDEGGTSHILFIFDSNCILILSAPALGLPTFDKILSTTSFCIKNIIFS